MGLLTRSERLEVSVAYLFAFDESRPTREIVGRPVADAIFPHSDGDGPGRSLP